MSSVRLRRLTADFDRLSSYARKHPRLRLIQFDGDPPERYQIEYRIRSLRQVDTDLKIVKSHLVEIYLPRNYPRTPPQCRMLSPVFHPNIAPHAICVGDHWSAGESLQSIVSRIGEMLAYQSYNVKSPLNGEAARWVDDHEDELPLDPVSLLVEESDDASDDAVADAPPPRRRSLPSERPAPQPASQSTAPAQSVAPPQPSDGTVSVGCPMCSREYRVPASAIGRKAKCQKCETVFPIEG